MTTKGVTSMPKTEYVIEPGKQEIRSTTLLDAPRELVFRAYTDPKLFVQWWGPRQYEVKIDKFESRPGGSWRGVHVPAGGGQHAVRGGKPRRAAPGGDCPALGVTGGAAPRGPEAARFEAPGH